MSYVSRRNGRGLHNRRSRQQGRMFYQAGLEPLERRQLLSLLGITPSFPKIVTNQTGTVNYTYNAGTATGSFDLSSAPLTFQASATDGTHLILSPSSFQIQFQTDASGNVTGGVAGADFTITGTVDLNNNFTADAGDISGTLLTGEISQFGYLSSGTTSQFDFTFTPTGGLLPTDYPAAYHNMNIGVSLTSEGSTFTGSFTTNFTGKVKATAGTVPAPSGGPVVPNINTSQQPASAIVGSVIADQATVTGGNNPTGTVTFNLYNNPNGTGTSLFTDTESLVNGIATSSGYTATATGTDYWVATYNGDSNNTSVTSGISDEPVTVTAASPSINTSQQPASATVGSVVADQATVSGGYNPTGTVTFNLYNNPNGTGTALFTDTEALVGGV
ncbi:MAG TPA: hypothetical protein VG722_10445, partial [Tepidisphaeraceae bacterium]|nr:hypothetical protein [Tepidisphaeraceae bacterium]